MDRNKDDVDGVKKDQNTPIEDIDVWNNPVTRSCIDRYIFVSPFCKDKTVLSLASGWGYGEAILYALGAKTVTCLDMDEDAINYINKRHSPNLKGVCKNFSTDEIDLQEKFDSIVSIETFEHIPQDDIPKLLNTIKRHAKPESTILITTPKRTTPEWEYNGGTHLYEYSFQEFGYIIKDFFTDDYDVSFFFIGEAATDHDFISIRMGNDNGVKVMVALIQPKGTHPEIPKEQFRLYIPRMTKDKNEQPSSNSSSNN